MKKLLFTGPVLTASGYGTHARQLLRALIDSKQFDIHVESIRWGETAFLNGADVDWVRALVRPCASPAVSVQVTIPNEFKRKAPLTIGVTAGIEVDRVSPQWLLACNKEVDLVVVPSEHSARAFAVNYTSNDGRQLRLDRPLAVVPEGVDTSIYTSSAASTTVLESNLPAKNLICVGLGIDKPDGKDRKNITKLIQWFCETFAGNKDVGLILKTSIVNCSVVDFEITKKRINDIKRSAKCGEFPRITLLHGRLSEQEMAAIYNDTRIVAAISLTHGEGFGLPLIEAAACGLPVIATDWSGHVDFLTKEGKKLFVPVAYDLAQIPQECVWEGVMEAGTCWANPREADAKIKMQKIFISSETPRVWATELMTHVAEHYDLKTTNAQFVDVVSRATAEAAAIPRTRDDLITAMKAQIKHKGASVVYTMPMSAGDVFLSTAVVAALKKKHPECRLYFATSPQYFSILKGLPAIDELIEWMPWMQDVSVLEDIFDEVYTPNLAVQMAWSNWIHKGKGRPLLDEFATQCNVDPVQLDVPEMARPEKPELHKIPAMQDGSKWIAVHSGGQKSARAYAYWGELVKNMRRVGLKVMQVGAQDDISIGEVDIDSRGLAYNELPIILQDCVALVGIDSFPMHVAACMGVPTVAIFGSSYPSTTGPQYRESRHRHLKLIETPDRHGCERACYKDVCKIDSSNPCINEIRPEVVWAGLREMLNANHLKHDIGDYVPVRPKIAGYTHIYNPKSHGYPFVQSIGSMLGFCDEVIVIDGGSTDGSVNDLKREFADHGETLKIITREWDPDEPGMDGMQKAFGRAMVSPDVEFLWQQDADEIVHERDYGKIQDLCKRFPLDVDVMHLPVVELWGDDRTCRTDRHSWKWRLSRNNLRVTHGINVRARRIDQETGRFYAEKGMSDGCEMIDIVTGEHLPHRGFYNDELEKMRVEDHEEYGRRMNRFFEMLPSVWHYSWADLSKKIRQFKNFWDIQWSTLYKTPPQPRFPDVTTDDDILRKAQELKERGGEHGPAPTFKLSIDPPASMA